MEVQKWEGKTHSGNFGLKALSVILKYVDVTVIYFLLIFIVPFHAIFYQKGSEAIYNYFHNILKYNSFKSILLTYVNHYRFGQVFIDRFVAAAGKLRRFNIKEEDNKIINAIEANGKGSILVSSHVGNFEIAGSLFSSENKKVNGLFFGGELAQIQQMRNVSYSRHNIQPILIKDDFSHVFAINNALNNGEIVTMVCDRYLPGNKYVECDFLGHKAKFPVGFAYLAVRFDVPVVVSFVMKERMSRYKVYYYLLDSVNNMQMSIQEKAESLVRQYVGLLESIVRKYPVQWFNFYNFWEV